MDTLRQFIHIHRILRRIVLIGLLAMAGMPGTMAQSVDVFCGVDFNFKDLNFKRQYDLLINLTPGFKWDMGNHWQLAGQVYVPVVNHYGEEFGYVRPNIFVLSKQMQLGGLFLKASAGKFSHDRYGLDMKAFLPLASWFALEAQAGYVGLLYTWPDWYIGKPDRFRHRGRRYLPIALELSVAWCCRMVLVSAIRLHGRGHAAFQPHDGVGIWQLASHLEPQGGVRRRFPCGGDDTALSPQTQNCEFPSSFQFPPVIYRDVSALLQYHV